MGRNVKPDVQITQYPSVQNNHEKFAKQMIDIQPKYILPKNHNLNECVHIYFYKQHFHLNYEKTNQQIIRNNS